MRILQVVPAYAPAWDYGGPARVVYELSLSLQRRGHDLTVYTTDAFLPEKHGDMVDQTVEDGIRVVRMRNASRLVAERLRVFHPYGFKTRAERDLDSFDVMHIHEYRTLYNATLRKLALRKKVPYFLSPHGSVTLNGQRQTAKRAFDSAIGKALLRDASTVFALTATEASCLTDLPCVSCPVVTIPNGVDLPRPADPAGVERWRQAWGVSRDKKVVLYFGRVARTKGIDLLVRAFATRHRSLADSHLVICGPDDGAKSDLRRLASSLGVSAAVTFAEPVYGGVRDEVLQAANVVSVPLFTGLPLVLLEAAANSRPALTATIAPELEWLDGTGGMTTAPEPNALALALDEILDQGDPHGMGEVARNLVQKRFTWDAVASAYEEHYERVRHQPGGVLAQ